MAKRIVFFNNKGGVGKTTLVYHTAYMLNELGHKVLVADFDPQANLTAMFLTQERLEEVYLEAKGQKLTITDAMQPVFDGDGYNGVHVENIQNVTMFQDDIKLIIGNLNLSTFEDDLSDAWTRCLNGKTDAFKKASVFDKIISDITTKDATIEYVLIDIGPNLGAINRSVLIASDYVVLPVGSDLFSLQGIENLGKTLTEWQKGWQKRLNEKPNNTDLELPNKKAKPVGYIAMQHTARESKPVKAYLRWSNRIPKTYRNFVLKQPTEQLLQIEDDVNCLGVLRHYHSLMPMAMEARKPIFYLKPADGAIGAHFQSVQRVYDEFKKVTQKILSACD